MTDFDLSAGESTVWILSFWASGYAAHSLAPGHLGKIMLAVGLLGVVVTIRNYKNKDNR